MIVGESDRRLALIIREDEWGMRFAGVVWLGREGRDGGVQQRFVLRGGKKRLLGGHRVEHRSRERNGRGCGGDGNNGGQRRQRYK